MADEASHLADLFACAKAYPGPTFGVVDVTSRFQVSRAFPKISKRGPLRWPKVLQVDPGREFMDDVTREMKARCEDKKRECEQFNRTLGERLFTFHYSQEINFREGKRSTEWVKRLSEDVSGLNSEVTRLTGKRPIDAINEKSVHAEG